MFTYLSSIKEVLKLCENYRFKLTFTEKSLASLLQSLMIHQKLYRYSLSWYNLDSVLISGLKSQPHIRVWLLINKRNVDNEAEKDLQGKTLNNYMPKGEQFWFGMVGKNAVIR